MKIGFTGTQKGMSERQLASLLDIFDSLSGNDEPLEFHHGDCIGADAEAHAVALKIANVALITVSGMTGWERPEDTIGFVVHPPEDKSRRAFCETPDWINGLVLEPLPYLQRNRDIVDAVDVLIAAPLGPETKRSGTWSTVRYARSQGVPVTMLAR